MKNNGFITLLSSDDFLKAVLVLNNSLKQVRSNYPLIVAITENIYNDNIIDILKNNDIIVEKIKKLNYSKKLQNKFCNNSVLNTASKIELFNLKQYDKLIYLDADSLIIKNVDELFEYPDGAMIKYSEQPWCATGLFVFEPKNHLEYEFFIKLLECYDCFDGDLIGKSWNFIHQNEKYKIPSYYLWYNQNMNIPKEVKILHFGNQIKPWIEPNHPQFNNEGGKLYKNFLQKIKI